MLMVKKRKLSTNIISSYSFWEEMLFRVPQGSILDLYSSIFFFEMFFLISDIGFVSYADDNTSYFAVDSIKDVIRKLEKDSSK